MVYRRISGDLKEAALRMEARDHNNVYDICAITSFSVRTFQRVRRQKHLTGSIAKQQAISHGCPQTLIRHDADYLLQLAHYKLTLFIDKYSHCLHQHCELSVSLATIHQTLKRAGLNVKHIQKLAAERDPFLHANFIRCIGQYPANYLLSVDEVSKDNHTYTHLWGRAPVGTRVEQHDPFVWRHRYSMIAALALDEGIVVARVLEGSFKHDTFYEYLHDDVLPLTTPFPGPRSVLLLDNARTHHSEDVMALVHSYGCIIEYLPPYSPDFQPVELAFSVIKSHLQCCGLSFFTYKSHYYELYKACEEVMPEMTWGFF